MQAIAINPAVVLAFTTANGWYVGMFWAAIITEMHLSAGICIAKPVECVAPAQ